MPNSKKAPVWHSGLPSSPHSCSAAPTVSVCLFQLIFCFLSNLLTCNIKMWPLCKVIYHLLCPRLPLPASWNVARHTDYVLCTAVIKMPQQESDHLADSLAWTAHRMRKYTVCKEGQIHWLALQWDRFKCNIFFVVIFLNCPKVEHKKARGSFQRNFQIWNSNISVIYSLVSAVCFSNRTLLFCTQH